MARAIAVRQVRAVKKTDPNWVLRAKAHPARLTPEASAQKKIILIKNTNLTRSIELDECPVKFKSDLIADQNSLYFSNNKRLGVKYIIILQTQFDDRL